MSFAINGSTASYAPQRQEWIDHQMGIDATGKPIYAATKHVRLDFDQCSLAHYRQWAGLHGTSLTRVTILNMDGSSYTEYSNSNIFLTVTQRPGFEAANATGWSVTLTGIVP